MPILVWLGIFEICSLRVLQALNWWQLRPRNITPFKAPHEHVGLNRDFSPGICLLLGAATARQKRQKAARADLSKPALPAQFFLLATPSSKLLSRLNAKCWKRKSWQYQGVFCQRYLGKSQHLLEHCKIGKLDVPSVLRLGTKMLLIRKTGWPQPFCHTSLRRQALLWTAFRLSRIYM